MKKPIISFVLLAFALSMASISLARAGPKENAFTHQAAQAAVTSANPKLVISFEQAITTPMLNAADYNLSQAYPRLASVSQYSADTSETSRLSTTVAKRSINAHRQPQIVLLR